MEANLQAKAVSVFRDAMKRRRSPQVAFEQAVTALIDRHPQLSRSIVRRQLAQLFAREEGFDPRLIDE